MAKIIVVLMAAPKISIDYVSKLNELTKPVGFDPERNAAGYFQEAYDLFYDMPQEIKDAIYLSRYGVRRVNWPTDIDANSLALLEEWVVSNAPALNYLREAIEQPYWWFERHSIDGSTSEIMLPELPMLRDLSDSLIWNAKLNASKGYFYAAINDILSCYRLGLHLTQENLTIMEQLLGIGIKHKATSTALALLHRTKPNQAELNFLKDSLDDILEKDNNVPGLEAEKLFQYDYLQRDFLDLKKNVGINAFRSIFDSDHPCCNRDDSLWGNGFIGLSKSEVIKQIERLFEINEKLKDKSPWYRQHQYSKQISEIETITNDNFFVKIYTPAFTQFFDLFQKTNAQSHALITVIAVLKFKAENDRLPETLDELLSSGYIESIPQDPYSNDSLVYVIVGDDFKLYSLGDNFEDNKAEALLVDTLKFSGFPPHITFSDPNAQETIRINYLIPEYKDIIYWPIPEPLPQR